MDIATTASINGVKIRLTDERWKHIVLMHPILTNKETQVLSVVKAPDYLFQGAGKELLAVSRASQRAYLVVVYKEEISDGFIITAFETTEKAWLFKKKLIWNKHS